MGAVNPVSSRQYDPALFLSIVEEMLSSREAASLRDAGLRLIGSGISAQSHALLVYKESPTGPLVALSVNLAAFASLFKPEPDEAELARIVVWDEMADPTGPSLHKVHTSDIAVFGTDRQIGWRSLTK